MISDDPCQPIVRYMVTMVSQISTYESKSSSLDPIGRFISARSRKAPPTKEEYESLFNQMNSGSSSARDELIERHIRLVASIALKFRMTNLPMEDLMAEGIQGLIVALDKFDHTRGVKLSTYAAWWIRQKIQRLVGKLSHPVTVPHDVSQGKRKYNQVLDQLHAELNRTPTDSEIELAMSGDRNISNRVKFAPKGSISLDQPVVADSDQTFSDVMSSEDDLSDSYRENGSLLDDIQVALGFLSERERNVLSMRFGIGKKESMKLDDIASEMNISGERVRQLESLGLRKLRAVLLQNGEIDFHKLDKLVRIDLNGKTKMSPLELSLVLDSAN
jgi:RNA polymerase primary sigma factor